MTFFRKSCGLWDNVEKYSRTGQATDDNKIRRMRFAGWINNATVTHSEYVTLTAILRQQWLRVRSSVLQWYVNCQSSAIYLKNNTQPNLHITEARFFSYRFLKFRVGRDGAVGIASGHGLDGPGIESLWGREFSHPSRLALWPTHPRVQWVWDLFPGDKAAGEWRSPLTPSSSEVKKKV